MEVAHTFVPDECRSGHEVVVYPHPFTTGRVNLVVSEGKSIQQMMVDAGLTPRAISYARVWLDQDEIYREIWERVRPKAGVRIVIKLTPKGSNLLRQLLMLVVVVASAFLAPLAVGALGLTGLAGQLAGTLIQAGLTIGGALLVNALIPPPKPDPASQHQLLNALRNSFEPFGKIPRVYGKLRIYPTIAAHPYTETVGKKRFLRAILEVGWGPLRISDIRIGDTDISVYKNVTVEVREGWTNQTFGFYAMDPVLDYTFNSSYEGFTGLNTSVFRSADGALRVVTSRGGDSYRLQSPSISINGYNGRFIRMRARRTSGTSWLGRVFFGTAGHGISASYYKDLADPFVANGKWTVFEWNMSVLTAGGTDYVDHLVNKIEFAFLGNGAANIEVDWIEVGSHKTQDADSRLFTKSVHEQGLGIKLHPSVSFVQSTEEDSVEFSVDVGFPGGLARLKKGKPKDHTVDIAVHYRKTNTSRWYQAKWESHDKVDGTQSDGWLKCKDKTLSEVVFGGVCRLPEPGQYDIQLRRVTKTNGAEYAEDAYWTAIRSYKREDPITIKGLATIAVRMQATDQFSSFPDQINCMAESYLPVYSDADNSWYYRISRNVAWAFCDLFRRRGTERMYSDDRLHLDDIGDWAAACDLLPSNSDQRYWQFDGALKEGSIYDNARQIAAYGRAAFTIIDGMYSVVRDVQQTAIRQHISPRNSFGYSGSRVFVLRPHGLRVKFTNAAKQYSPDEIIVYDAGYNADNATRFESLELPYCTSAKQAWREGKYHMAVAKYRPEEHRVSMDIEALGCTMGDLVRLTHDVFGVGIGSARVTSITEAAGRATAITIDETLDLPVTSAGLVVRVRRKSGSSLLVPINAPVVATSTNLLEFKMSIDSGLVAVGDLVMVGLTDAESVPVIVKRVEPGADMTVTLTLISADERVWKADGSVLDEDYQDQGYASDQLPPNQQRPLVPVFTLDSGEKAVAMQSNGSMLDRIMVSISQPAGNVVQLSHWELQYRPTDAANYENASNIPIGVSKAFISPVVKGDGYDIRLRSVAVGGLGSDWVEVENHVVGGVETPPEAITGLLAVPTIDGVQISWDPSAEEDVVGYEVRIGSDWDSAVVASDMVSGTSFFYACDTTQPNTFLVKAFDGVGLESEDAAIVTSEVLAIQPVAKVYGYIEGDNVSLVWSLVEGKAVRYEIRRGNEWASAQSIGIFGSTKETFRSPSSQNTSGRFWVDTISVYGAYSGKPSYVDLDLSSAKNANVVVTKNLSVLGYPGKLLDTVINGSAIELGKSGAVAYSRGEYIAFVDLLATRSARTWVEMQTASVVDNDMTWTAATFPWDDDSGRTWQGLPITRRAGAVTARMAINAALPSKLVEGFRFNGSMTGAKAATAPSINSGTAYASCRFENGLEMNPKAAVRYAVTVPSTFSITFDFRVRVSGEEDQVILQLNGTGTKLMLVYRSAGRALSLVDHNGKTQSVVIPMEITDVLTIGISQSATERGLFAGSRRYRTTASKIAGYAALGSFSQVNFNPA